MNRINKSFNSLACSWHCWRTANISLEIMKDFGFVPKTIIDVGADANQVTKYWIKEWPQAHLISIEPNPNCNPMGQVIRAALGNQRKVRKFITDGLFSRISVEGNIEVPVHRFDMLPLDYEYPALLKVDCEDGTYDALQGMGKKLKSFSVVHVEMLNHCEFDFVNRQSEIHALMWEAGFKYQKTVDAICWPRNISCTDVLFLKVGEIL
jgi:FkbM family methyltransferase